VQRLRGQLALVTGAGSGIGKAIAVALASEGARLALVGRTAAKLELTAQELAEEAQSIQVFPADLTLDATVQQLGQHVGEVDILVMAGGEYTRGPIAEAPVSELDALYFANVRANYLLTQTLLPALKRRQGQIVFINSSTGLEARAEVGQFSATNHALRALADALRAEVNPAGVRVVSVYPGRTATPRQMAIYASLQQEYHPELLLQPEDVAAVVLAAVTLARTAEITDVTLRPLNKSY
jgi:NADP-dependent 3-hydroxy acid dehydrogenase YdfG